MKSSGTYFLHLLATFLLQILAILAGMAHFYRSGEVFFQTACLAMLILLFIRNTVTSRIVQCGFFLLTLEWAYTAWHLASARVEEGADWKKLAIILGSVTLYTFVCGLLIQLQTAQVYYQHTR